MIRAETRIISLKIRPRIISQAFCSKAFLNPPNTNPNFWIRISSGGVRVFRLKGWEPKSLACPSQPREPNFWAGYPGLLPGHPRCARKVWEKQKFVFNFRYPAKKNKKQLEVKGNDGETKKIDSKIRAWIWHFFGSKIFPWTGKSYFSNRAFVKAIFEALKCI